jgi:hypothetical protein
MLGGFVTGFLFGFVLHRAGLVRYSRVIGVLLLRDLKALKFLFLSLTVAMLGYGISDLSGLGIVPRVNPYLGMGHILGGALFGVGMGVSSL